MRTTKVSKTQLKTMLIITSIALIWSCASMVNTLRYNTDNYCCRQMSRDLEDRLESIGIPIKIVRGQD